jgi:LemA protein
MTASFDTSPRNARPPRALLTAVLALVLGAGALGTTGCGFNTIVEADEDVKASWAEVQNQYKRRADMVPQLVSTVSGAAKFERETFTQVAEARAKVGTMQIDQGVIDSPEKLRAFDAAQSHLSGALSRLMVVSEKYPELKANASFRDLQTQLEGTENRITVARQRFILAVSGYNKQVQVFPTMLGAFVRGRHVRPTFEGTPGNEAAPEIKF